LEGYDYNKVLSAFYIGYIIFELPATLACKRIGPGWFIPGMALGFGSMTIATAFSTNIANASAIRFLLGLFEAGMLPSIAYYLSRFYRRNEFAFRLAMYIVMSPLAGAFSGLLASAILKIDHIGTLTQWRMIFLVEGVITCFLAILAFFSLTDRPETAIWLSPAEKELAIARVKSERTGVTEVLDPMNRRKLLRGIANPVVIVTAFLFCLSAIQSQGLAFFAPTIVRSLYPDASPITQQLRTVPPYLVGACFVLALPYLARRTGKFLIWYILVLPLTIAGYIMFIASRSQAPRYAATFLISTSAFCFGAISNALISANVISDSSRAAGIGLSAMLSNIGGLISTWSYLENDKPDYFTGNGLNMGCAVLRLIGAVGLVLWMKRDNEKRDIRDVDGEMGALGEKEVQDLDWVNPVFRWRP
jgi:MFS family permease